MAFLSVPSRPPPTKVGHVESVSYKEDWAELEAVKDLFLDRDINARYRSIKSKEMLEAVLAKGDLHVFHRAWAHGLLATVHVLLSSAADFRLAKYHAEMSIHFYQEVADRKLFNPKPTKAFLEQSKMYYINLMMSVGNTFPNAGPRMRGVGSEGNVKFLNISLEYDSGSEDEMEDYDDGDGDVDDNDPTSENSADAGH